MALTLKKIDTGRTAISNTAKSTATASESSGQERSWKSGTLTLKRETKESSAQKPSARDSGGGSATNSSQASKNALTGADTTAQNINRKSFFSYDQQATASYGQANRSPMGDVPRNAVRAEKKEGPTLASRIKDTVIGGAKGALGADINAAAALYDGTKNARNKVAQVYVEDAQRGLEESRYALALMQEDNRKQPGTWTEKDLAQQQGIIDDWTSKLDVYGRAAGAQRGATQESYQLADQVQAAAAQDVERAKAGLGGVGRVLVDAGASMTQTTLDAAANLLTGGASMAPFAFRAFGGGTQQARQDNPDSTLGQQLAYGTASAAKEVFTEKMFNIALPFARAYGGGALDDVVERGIRKAVDRFAKTDAGKRALGGALTFGAGAVSEGLEELIGDWMEWQMPRIYGGDVASAGETLESSLYDFLVGAASGAMGGVISPGTYQYDIGDTTGARQDTAIDNAYRAMSENGMFSQEADTARGQARDSLGIAREQQYFVPQTTQTAQEAQADDGDRALLETARSMAQERQEAAGGQNQQESQVSREITNSMEQVRRAAGALGESGGKALTAAYTADTARTISPRDAVEGFYKVYNAALNGKKLSDIDTESAAALPAHLRFAAESAGQQDALRAKQAQFFGEKAGLVKDDTWKQAHLSSKTNRTLDALGKALGVQIKFAETVAEGTANGQYADGTITLALDGENPVMTTVTHETVHRLREMSPEAYSALADFVQANLSEDTAEFALVKRGALNESSDVSAMTEEMVADAFGRVLNDGKAIEQLVQDNRSLAEKVRDVLADIVNAVKRVLNHQNLELTTAQKAEFQELENKIGQMERLFSDALGKAALQTETGNGTMSAANNSIQEVGTNGRGKAGSGGFQESSGRKSGQALDGEGNKGTGGVRGELSDAAGRHGGVNPNFGAKPVRTWAEGHTVEPARGSAAYTEQQVAAEYGVPSFVVADEAWAKNKGNTPAFSAGGQIYLRESLPEKNRGMYVPHEVTHVMKQVGYQPYLDFVERTPEMLNMSDPLTRQLLDHTAKHQGVDGTDADPIRLYDELNATIYGHYAAGKMEELNDPLHQVFHDFDTYISELNEIHERFKAENGKGKKYSLKEYTAEEKKQHVKDALAYFGRTFKWAETGYITTDGKRLDFSGRHDGAPGGYRTVDHRDISDALGLDYGGDDYSGAMVQFMGEGNIRISPESGGINLSVMPTKAQLDTLSDFISKQRGEVILDLDAPGGDTVFSTEYPRGTHASKVLGDIKAYFEEGKQPYVSEVSKFLYSKKEKNRGQDIAAMQEENRLLREQLGDYIRLQKQNETLRESREYWKGQTHRTERVTTDKKAVGKAARELVQSYGAEVSAQQVQDKLQSLYDYMASGYDGKDELTFTEAWKRAKDIAQDLVENATAQDDELYRQYGDLRQYMKDTALVVTDQVKGDITDYGDFRKRNLGRMRLVNGTETNIDQVYKDLSERWPEFFDEQMQMTPTDQLLQISQVLNEVGTVDTYNPFSTNMQEAVAGAANEIMETFFDLPQTKKTFADRAALRLEEAKGKGRQQVQKVREDYSQRLAQLREQNRARVQKVIAKERETRAKKIDALKENYKAKDAAGRERRAARELRAKIIRHASALSQKLLRPSDQHHIPEAMRGSVAAMLESINQESQYTLDENGKRVKNGDGTPTKRTEAFRALKEQYAKIVAEGGDMVIDPSLLGSDADGIKGGFDAVIAMKDIKLADMSVAQLQTVWQVVKAVEHSVNTAGKVLSKAKYARTADWAQAISIGTSSRRAKNSLTRNHALIDLETPYTFFSHYGEAGKAVYRMLRDAQDQQQLMVDHVAEEVRKIVDPKTVKKLETTTHTFTTERGEKLTLSTAQVMELYELVKRKQAHDHLLKGGVVQPEIKTSQIRRGTDSIRLTEGDLASITGTLTPEQVKIADGLQGLTRGVLADYGNKASMEAYGYKKFTENDYWPIKSAKEGLHSNIEKGGNNTRSIKNIGMAKTTMPHASNALDLAGIFTTFANHASDMTDYASWLCTMEDINRLFNYQFRDEEGNPTGKTIKGLLDRVGGPGSQKYWHNLMEDIQNGINAPGDSPMWDIVGKTIGGFKGAAVGANIRVVIQQPTAFFRAAAVLDPQDMARGLARGVTRGNGWKKALRYSPIAMRKDTGGFDISSPYQMTETLFDNRTNVRKLNDALSAPAGAADAVTWGKLWNACEWATAREHQGLERGSQAFYKQTAKLFAEVIDQTQVVDGVLQRSNIMRSSNAVVKQATSFMGEPIMSLNLLMRAYDQVRYEQNSQKRGKAIKTMGRAATALVVTNVVNALAQSLIDAMRDDDADKKYWERFRAAFTGISGDEETPWEKAWNAIMVGNVGSNMNPLGQIPFVKDALSIMQGYDVSRTEMEIVSDLIQAGQTAIQSADGQGKRTRAYALKGLLAAGAKMFGIPASNLTRDMWGLARSAAVETGNIPLQYEMEKAIYNISNTGNKNRYYAILYRALEQGEMDSYQHIREDLMDQMGLDGASIDSAMRTRYNKAVEQDGDYTLPQNVRDLIGSRDRNEVKTDDTGFDESSLSAEQYDRYASQKATAYRSILGKGESLPGYSNLDESGQNSFEAAANTYAKETALEAAAGGQYSSKVSWVAKAQEAERKYGIAPGVYAK